ncbi:MAG: restriction endonuclease [Angustibacter sp.]
MAPSLTALSDGRVWGSRELITRAATLLGLTADQRQIRIPSGQEQWINRGNWALSYLYRASAVDRVSRGRYLITDVGRHLLATTAGEITEKCLRPLYPEPTTPGALATADSPAEHPQADSLLDPTELIDAGISRINDDVASQLLRRLRANDPEFFEQVVLDLIIAMGYGGANGTGTRTRLSRDGGIDGIVDQDALGLSRIYLQAKRYGPDNTVGRPAIQEFVGALQGKHANQGVFLTTSHFSAEAHRCAQDLSLRVVLIDGSRLAHLMVHYGVGVQLKRTIRIMELDEDYFE